ncbi:MAG: acetyl-CoA carboxylase biotin carboxylase subunit [Deltaproteobacteria bacterium]|nr:acetyl-CoA carboxylase biotin carboxylase subunit [Deltaproteobacteria bacterium]MCW5801907.1 acetyl-CoA carboxylase biotin carboxylase subunit [Deltaproteobacteria bacterium]
MSSSSTVRPRPIRRVLVANRGEIAVRVMRTCQERGVSTVAVYSDADRLAPHVQLADAAVHIGPPPSAQSYLVIDKILEACRATGADAVHPGYGFLSENEDFADACAAAGITFIGPSADAMRRMGSKTEARKTVAAAGTPVVPGDNGPTGEGFPTAELALASAQKIGFPILIKAAAGGGGKGMRLVAAEAELAAAFDGARREATAAFGDGTVYLEKAIQRPRHIEIQVFGDTHGNLVHLGERDCSIQRRHQKVIEEAPSPVVSAELRARMGAAAVAAARAVDYVGAGTCEFLLGADGGFYFLEMNTRLQVEHPVTEMIYNLDLVAWQLEVAEGRPLPLTQEQLDARRRGHALECRIYAEDPVKFLPSPGRITHLRVPDGPYVRNDSGCYEGAEIPVHYDPMISKLVVWGEDRAAAVGRMRRALDEYCVRGIETNLAFHRRCLRHAGFVAGDFDTGFIARNAAELAPRADEAELDAAIIAAALEAGAQKKPAPSATARETPYVNGLPSSELSGWRRQLR